MINTNKGKRFYYKQISFVRDFNKRYADSVSHNYNNLFVKKSMFKELLERGKNGKRN